MKSSQRGRHGQRKSDHIRINMQEPVEPPSVTTGFETLRLRHRALPELDLADVDASTSLFGRRLKLPLLISSMTGGTAEAEEVNCRLAEAAQDRRVAMGVGSQRIMLESRQSAASWSRLRSIAPDIPLLANLGLVQLNRGFGLDQCQRVVDAIEADALYLHCNALQECIQEGGDTEWSGLLRKLEQLCRALPVPVLIKEVGWGIDGPMAGVLRDAGVAGIDVAGAGGTSWSEVERHRAADELVRRTALAFQEWGLPTAFCLRSVREELQARGDSDCLLIASGGLRSGLDMVKAYVLGADVAGFARPFLLKAVDSLQAVIEEVDILHQVVRTAMFCLGRPSISSLQGKTELLLDD